MYADYFPEYSIYFGIDLRLLKSMYGMTNSGKLFSDELKDSLFNESGFKNINARCLYIKICTRGKCFYNRMMIIVSIGIQMKLLENGLWTL